MSRTNFNESQMENQETSISSIRQPSLVINAISNWTTLGVNVVIGFLLTPFIISHLGQNRYGIWTLIASFIGYYGLLNLGVRSAITRYVARYAGQGDEKRLNETASTAMAMFICTGALVIAASFLLAAPAATFFDVAPEHSDDFKAVFWILGLAIGLSFPGNVFSAIIIAHERYVPANFARITTVLLQTGLTVVMLLRGKGLLGVAYANLISSATGIGVNFLLYRHFTPQLRMILAAVKWRVLRMLVVYGGVTTVIAIADVMRMNLDSFVIGKWVGMAEVGVYGIAALLIRYMVRLVSASMVVLTPRFAALDGAKERAKLQDLFLRSLSISALLAFGAGMLAIVFGGRFITFWVGEDFAKSIVILQILAISFAFALSQNPGIGLMYALNKHHFFAIATIIEAIANLILSILLVSKYGIIGVAMGTAVPMLIVKVFVQPIYVARIANVSIWNYIKCIIIPATLGGFMIYLAYSMGIVIFLDKCNLVELVICGIAAGLIFVGIVLLVYRQLGLRLSTSQKGKFSLLNRAM